MALFHYVCIRFVCVLEVLLTVIRKSSSCLLQRLLLSCSCTPSQFPPEGRGRKHAQPSHLQFYPGHLLYGLYCAIGMQPLCFSVLKPSFLSHSPHPPYPPHSVWDVACVCKWRGLYGCRERRGWITISSSFRLLIQQHKWAKEAWTTKDARDRKNRTRKCHILWIR